MGNSCSGGVRPKACHVSLAMENNSRERKREKIITLFRAYILMMVFLPFFLHFHLSRLHFIRPLLAIESASGSLVT